MSKRKKVQISGTKAGRNKKCKGNSLENTETQILTPDLDTSSAEESGECSFEKKEFGHSKVFLPPTQEGKFKPVFTKPKKRVAERHERDEWKDSTVSVEQGMVDSSGSQCMVRNAPATAERPFQNTMSPLGSLRFMDLLLPKEDQVILPHEEESERLDTKMQDQERTGSVNSEDVLHQKLEIANNLHINICEKEMLDRQISFVPKTSDNEDAEDHKRDLIQEMSIYVPAEGKIIDHLKNSQCEGEPQSSSNMSVEQNEAMQDIKKSVSVEEMKNENNVTQPSLLMDLSEIAPEEQSSKLDVSGIAGVGSGSNGKGLDQDHHENENHITQVPIQVDLSVFTPVEQRNNLHIHSVAGMGNGSDGKDIDQDPHDNNVNRINQAPLQVDLSVGTPVEQSSNLQISSLAEKGNDNDGKGIDQNLLYQSGTTDGRSETGDKSGEQSSPCRREVTAAERTIYEQDNSRNYFPATPTLCIDLEKEVNVYELKCKPDIETSHLFYPQPDETGPTNISPDSETRRASLQSDFYNEDSGPMIAKPTKNSDTSQEEEIPVLFQPQQWKESECEMLMPDNKQFDLDEGNLRPSEIRETLFNASITHQNLTKSPKVETKSKTENSPYINEDEKEIETCGEIKSQEIHVDISLSSTNALSQLETERRSPIIPNRDFNTVSEVKQPHLMSGNGSSIFASSDFDHETQTHSLCKDQLNLEYLSHSQLQQDISESNYLEFPLDKLFSTNNQHKHSKGIKDHFAAGGAKGNEPSSPVAISGIGHPNNARVEMERICDPSEEEDATDVVCGLIKELSNLNRLIMSKHRDLDSFKRLKFRRNRQSGKSLLHGMNNMTSTLCTMKKKEI